MEPLVVVLTPVYNGAKYLAECIESVLKQTYRNWEYYILDNASTDKTLEIAKHYEKLDPRIKVFHYDELVQVIDNHNRAFRLVPEQAKYVKVVSADDWLFPECIAKLVEVAERHPPIGVVGCYQMSGGGADWHNWEISWQHIPYPSELVSGREISRIHYLDRTWMEVFGSPTSLLYRADLVRATDKFYPNQTAEADTSAVCRCLQTTDYGFVHQVLCYERTSDDERVTATSRRMNAYLSSSISDIIVYGTPHLEAIELDERVREIIQEYYRFLSNSLLRRRDRKFWDYHEKRMSEIGFPLNRIRLYKEVAKRIIAAIKPEAFKKFGAH